MDNIEKTSFQIISLAGSAKSNMIGAIREAKKYNFKKAEEFMELSDEDLKEAQKVHFEMIKEESNNLLEGKKSILNLILAHAEDQLMTTQFFEATALEFIDMYKKMEKLEKK